MNPTMTEAPVAKEALTQTLQAFNLSEGEYQKVVSHLRREPNFTELGMFSALWSEHCCYKHTRHLLKKLPVTGPQIVQGPGENAGIVDCGDGIHVAFKVESHNHPTAVEPYQGAATGVGGILRDIITMNARPVALLNALRFGPIRPEESSAATRNHYLFTGAIKGIGDYGNCVGIPTIAGDVFFHENYSQNPLVNAMAIGIMEPEGMMSAQAAGIGNPVIYAGSPTGRDGMGGASFASKALDESQRAEDRPAVQVGDPFLEKLVLEACLEAFKTGAIVAAQDMGAAGLTCSCAEMADKGGVGMKLDLDKVPARERGMQAFEYLLSESQERMMMVVEKGREQEIFDVFDKWKIPAVVVGEVIAQPRFQVYHQGRQVVDLPVDLLTRLAPAYGSSDRPEEPEFLRFRRTQDAGAGLPELSLQELAPKLEGLLGSLNIVERHGVFVQYDRHVRNNTLLSSENDCAGVIRLRKPDGSHSGRALAATLDGQPRFVALEPYMGSLGIVAEAARNLACVGARPLAVTDNLNFGDPDVEEVAYQLYYTVEGIKEACIALDTPVTGGNVSLYNTTDEGAIIPSPVIGMVGLLTDDQEIMTPWFKQAGDAVALLGRFQPSLGGGEYQAIHGQPMVGAPPSVSLKAERFLVDAMVESLIPKKRLKSAQDVSTGGLLTTLVECLLCQGDKPTLGLKLDLDALQASLSKPLRLDALLFGETHGSYVISYEPGGEKAIEKTLTSDKKPADVGFIPLGTVLDRPVVELTLAGETVEIPLQPLFPRWKQGLGI